MATFPQTIALVEWSKSDGISWAMRHELQQQGYSVVGFQHDEPVPTAGIDVVLTFAPYGRLQQIMHQLAQVEHRPIFVHWNTENYPNPQLPWPVVRAASGVRAWIDRLNDSTTASAALRPLLQKINERMIRFRLVGEYRHAIRSGQLDLLFESSKLYVDMHRKHGVPARFVPWGTVPSWHEQLNLTRDIDVLWMGKRRTKRRSDIIDRINERLTARGYVVHVADSVVQPFIYADQRTEMLNRAKITLNLESEAYDNALPYRYHIAAANGSLVVSETLLPHYPVEPGVHYVAAKPDALVETLLHYLDSEAARSRIVENAYRLLTTELTLHNSLKQIMQTVARLKSAENPQQHNASAPVRVR